MFSAKVILSPIDFSDFSLQALEVAQDIAKRYGSELVLVHVVPVIPKLEGHARYLHRGRIRKQIDRQRQDSASQTSPPSFSSKA